MDRLRWQGPLRGHLLGLLWLCVGLMWVGGCRAHSLFTCEPIRVHRCLEAPYNMTFFPNIMEHYDQDVAAAQMEPFVPLMKLQCSPLVHQFLCEAFFPRCDGDSTVRDPCRQDCQTVMSDCAEYIRVFDISWPPELQCNRLPHCGFLGQQSPGTTPPRSSEKRDLGVWCPLRFKTKPGLGSSFLGAPDCAPPCANMFFKPHDVAFARSFVGVCSVVCLGATLFTFLTFLIDVKRFRYPERPIVFYAVCYSLVALLYFLGFLLGERAACAGPYHPTGVPTVVLGAHNKGCTLLFMLLYFFTIAGLVWWLILTITWFLAAGPKWSCEAIEKKAVWFHSAAWGIPGALTVMLLALNKVEGDNLSGVCFVGLYDLDALRYFVLAPLCAGVLLGLCLILAGIVSLNHVRRVIQHDERNQEKLKKFMIRIGVFSGLYLLPLVTLLACYTYEQSHRRRWEETWLQENCHSHSVPCPTKEVEPDHPDLTLFLVKYLMTLVVGISSVFWVSSKKTCSEWAYFCNRTRKRDPISESRRVLQESCEFFLKHNSRVQHKKKHYKPSSHKLKVVSKSMGTSTGGVPTSASVSAVTSPEPTRAAIGAPEPMRTAIGAPESMRTPTGGPEPLERGVSGRSSRRGVDRDSSERRSKASSSGKVSSISDSLVRATDGRNSPRSEHSDAKVHTSTFNVSHCSDLQDSSQAQLLHPAPEERLSTA